MNQEINNVAIYIRRSRKDEGKDAEETLASHKRTLTEMCKKRNWDYIIYEEIASGENRTRAELDAMLLKVEQGAFDAILVHAVDRLGRDKKHNAEIHEKLYLNDVLIVTPDKIYEWDSDEDMMLLDFQSMLSAQELRITKRRLRKGKLDASKQGFWAHGTPPLGYNKDPQTKKLVPNDDSKHIKSIFYSIAKGKTVSDVYNELNMMGVKTREGKPFSFNAIYRIVNHEAYKGTLVYNRYKTLDERKKNGKHKTEERPKSEWKRIEDAHPAIIDEATWEKANEIVNTYSFAKKRKSSTTYPTSRFTYCGTCGGTLTFQVAHTGKLYVKHCLKCGNRTYQYKPILEGIRAELIPHHQKLIDLITALEQTGKDENIDYKKGQIQKQIKTVERALDNLLIGYEEGDIDRDKYRERKAFRQQQLEQLHQELDELNKLDPTEQITNLQKLKKQVEQLFGKWHRLDDEGLTDEALNKSLNIIIEKVIWTYPKGEDVEPKLHIQFRE